MQCPKDKNVMLVDNTLGEDLAVKHCPECEGNWIRPEEYKAWLERELERREELAAVASLTEVDFVESPYDMKAGLCPDCKRYLTRAKVMLKVPFYVERCPNCGGFWCDRGEWEVLEQLGLHENMEQLFTGEWHSQIRSVLHAEKERHATIDKLGPEIAERVFELAEFLENHPHGDFAIAYLMRRLDKPQ